MKNIVDTLEERGFIEAKTGEEIRKLVEKPVALYVGFDPTSDSLHLGNLVGIIALAWFQRFGHHPIALVGGATGMIGDPSGKSVERNLLDATTLQHNIEGIRRSLKAVLQTEVTIVNNIEWFQNVGFINFLRDVESTSASLQCWLRRVSKRGWLLQKGSVLLSLVINCCKRTIFSICLTPTRSFSK